MEKTATKAGSTADEAAQNKIYSYAKFASTHIAYPFAVETADIGPPRDMTWSYSWRTRSADALEDTGETTVCRLLRRPFLSKRKSSFLPKQQDHWMIHHIEAIYIFSFRILAFGFIAEEPWY